MAVPDLKLKLAILAKAAKYDLTRAPSGAIGSPHYTMAQNAWGMRPLRGRRTPNAGQIGAA